MITLLEKTINYSVTNETEGFKLKGTITIIDETQRIANFNGSFTDAEDHYMGNFYYSENQDGKATKSVSDTPTENALTLDNFFDATISELKNQNNDNE